MTATLSTLDPLDELADRLSPRLVRPVDALEVAATLESAGVTDRAAAVTYRQPDVFALGEELLHRVRRRSGPPVPRATPAGGGRRALADLSHGGLYLVPLALFPPLGELLRPWPVAVVIATGALGWVWSGGAAWVAYQLLGRGSMDPAVRWLRRCLLAALPVAATLGALVGGLVGGLASSPAGLRAVGGAALLAAGQISYQMAMTLALFRHRERWLLLAMVPGVAASVGYLRYGVPGAPIATAVVAASVTTGLLLVARCGRPDAGGVAGAGRAARPRWRARRGGTAGAGGAARARWGRRAGAVGAGRAARRRGGLPVAGLPRGQRRELPTVLLSTGLTAAVLIYAQSRYLTGDHQVLYAAIPLYAGMGVVEWRARRYTEGARELLDRLTDPRRFARRAWTGLLGGLVLSMSALAALAAPLLVALRGMGLLSPAAVTMAAAHVAFGGACFLAFILAGHARYGRLSCAFGAAFGAHAGPVAAVAGLRGPVPDTVVFLGSVVLLQALLLVCLADLVGQAWRYR
ncbi:hypothetical protein ACFFWC_30480 [Plantactinospora siamensis]|uniref:Uncharacterized protein n=1 Tax=Plantactinospora siamensis TaxID=555372 RepID=A0ABV6P8B9_9ACTN